MTPLERVNLMTMLNDITLVKSQLAILIRDMANDHAADRLHVTCLDTAVERLDGMANKVNEILDRLPEGS